MTEGTLFSNTKWCTDPDLRPLKVWYGDHTAEQWMKYLHLNFSTKTLLKILELMHDYFYIYWHTRQPKFQINNLSFGLHLPGKMTLINTFKTWKKLPFLLFAICETGLTDINWPITQYHCKWHIVGVRWCTTLVVFKHQAIFANLRFALSVVGSSCTTTYKAVKKLP
jgi:hypothetical protein